MDQVVIGVDTHKSNHIAVAIDAHGARLGEKTIPTTSRGYRDLEIWASGFGRPRLLVLKEPALLAPVSLAPYWQKAMS